MRFDDHRVDTGSEKHEGRTFGICKNMVGAISPGMRRSGISSPPSSLSGPGADAECVGLLEKLEQSGRDVELSR
jgi:hypothetical protein